MTVSDPEPLHVKAKICGIRSGDDLTKAHTAGAEAVGLICGVTHFSEDCLLPDEAKRLSTRAIELWGQGAVTRTLVTHEANPDTILGFAELIGVERIQLHGLIPDETVHAVMNHRDGREVYRAVHVTDLDGAGPADALDAALRAAEFGCAGVVLDTRTSDRIGGTGRIHDWTISRKIVEALAGTSTQVSLAGGLTPDNVREAIDEVRPHSVDVNTGVQEPGDLDKSATRCEAFTRIAHSWTYTDHPLHATFTEPKALLGAGAR
ncbi:phosphoribosylanthranilate isomerase [Nocardia neocaledoniensis]|uniref:phosphoribosylanthranilate isomerase n=1 Tax=Nocardia neocaledoniensis TaxID=236511 RepID=UPI0033C4F6AF